MGCFTKLKIGITVCAQALVLTGCFGTQFYNPVPRATLLHALDPSTWDTDGDGHCVLGHEKDIDCPKRGLADCNDHDPKRWQDVLLYRDSDGDTFNTTETQHQCIGDEVPEGWVARQSPAPDCDDNRRDLWQSVRAFKDIDGDTWTTGFVQELCVGPRLEAGWALTASTREDNCPEITNNDQGNFDGDTMGDVCDADDDNDSVPDVADCNDFNIALQTELTFYRDKDGDGFGVAGETTRACSLTPPAGYVIQAGDPNDQDANVKPGDRDGDKVADAVDNCPDVSNANQANFDRDAQGDVCDADDDNDGRPDTTDCDDFNSGLQDPLTYYRDSDGDGYGVLQDTFKACALTAPTGYAAQAGDPNDQDPNIKPGDRDGDKVGDATDNCPDISNVTQANFDRDAQGDACDADDDNDNRPDTTDCDDFNSSLQDPLTYYRDKDGDGFGVSTETTQACSLNPPTGYVTLSGDPNDQDPNIRPGDRDGDKVADAVDNCPDVANASQANFDKDAMGDACDADDDNDGRTDDLDCNDFEPALRDPISYYLDVDADEWGVSTGVAESCTLTPPMGYAAKSGDNCPTVKNTDQMDTDHDGMGDACDTDTPDERLHVVRAGVAIGDSETSMGCNTSGDKTICRIDYTREPSLLFLELYSTDPIVFDRNSLEQVTVRAVRDCRVQEVYQGRSLSDLLFALSSTSLPTRVEITPPDGLLFREGQRRPAHFLELTGLRNRKGDVLVPVKTFLNQDPAIFDCNCPENADPGDACEPTEEGAPL